MLLMKALVINLKKSKDRMEFMKNQLVRLKIDYERIDAIDANDINDDFYNNITHDWHRPMKERRWVVFCI